MVSIWEWTGSSFPGTEAVVSMQNEWGIVFLEQMMSVLVNWELGISLCMSVSPERDWIRWALGS